jgi:hypothetical protein
VDKYTEHAEAIAKLAQAIADQSIPGSRYAAVMGLSAMVDGLVAWTQDDRIAPAPEPPAGVWHCQVQSPDGGRLLTYVSDQPVQVGEIVILPPLPWMRDDWTAEVVGLAAGEYEGELRYIVGRVHRPAGRG